MVSVRTRRIASSYKIGGAPTVYVNVALLHELAQLREPAAAVHGLHICCCTAICGFPTKRRGHGDKAGGDKATESMFDLRCSSTI